MLTLFYKDIRTKMEFSNSEWGARNRGGIGLLYRSASLYRLAEFILWYRFWSP
jgi:hypothetical protein